MGYLLDVGKLAAWGYEPSINIFGPLEGEWFVERSLDLLKLVVTPEREDAEAPGLKPLLQGARFDRLQFALRTPQRGLWCRLHRSLDNCRPRFFRLFVRTRANPPVSAQPAAQISRGERSCDAGVPRW